MLAGRQWTPFEPLPPFRQHLEFAHTSTRLLVLCPARLECPQSGGVGVDWPGLSRFEMSHMKHTWMSGLLVSMAALWAQPSASAPPPPRANGPCANGVKEARRHVEAGHLRQARQALTECAKSTCGALSRQCQAGLQRLESDIPSVVVVATDGSGATRVDVRVSVDGELLTSQLDGRGVDVDPGMHEFSFSTDQGDAHSEKILILQGQRNRVISVTLKRAAAAPPDGANAPAAAAAPPSEVSMTPATEQSAAEQKAALAPAANGREVAASASTERPRSSPLLAYVVGGAGLAAVGSSLLLAHWGREDNLLLDRCAPDCSQASVDHVSNMYIAADIALGAGVVALGAATWLYLTRPQVEDEKAATYRFDVQPTASGAYATVGRAF
jgi:hypothetical protein